jgi:uncharacterized membrane protein YeaQ/YmgE (transglycosylase-associated protein family)
MIPETSAALAAFAAAVSTALLALFGVDYHSLLYALIGAMFAVFLSERMSRGRAVLYTLLSTLAGAVLGNVLASHLGRAPQRIELFGLCIVGGLCAQAVAAGILRASPRVSEVAAKFLERILGRGGPAA